MGRKRAKKGTTMSEEKEDQSITPLALQQLNLDIKELRLELKATTMEMTRMKLQSQTELTGNKGTDHQYNTTESVICISATMIICAVVLPKFIFFWVALVAYCLY